MKVPILANINRFINDFFFGFADESKLVTDNLGKDFAWFVKRKCNITVSGLENLPQKEEPFIIAGNHLKVKTGFIRPVYDAFIVATIIYENTVRNIRWLARPTMAFDLPKIGRRIPLPLRDFMLNIFEYKYGAIMIDTSLGDKAKFKVAEDSVKALENGDVVGIMPEGDLFDTLSKARKGLYYISKGYNDKHPDKPIKIVPVAAWGLEKGELGKKRDVQVHFCRPMTLEKFNDAQDAVNAVMIEIAKVLPEKYRGYYAMAVDAQL